MTDGNALVETDCPIGKEYGSHGVISCLYHLVNFPKLINIGWGVSVSEPKLTSDGVKVTLYMNPLQEIGSWICLLIKGGDTPKTLPLPSIAGGH